MSQKLAVKIKSNFYKLEENDELEKLNSNEKIVCETSSALQIGEVIRVCSKKLTDTAKFVRIASKEDIEKNKKLQGKKSEVLELTNNLVKKYNLDMKLVDVDFSLDNSKVIISFVCEDRVDFRDLVKELAGNLKTRIELKQIGIRDQARLIGSIGVCGKEVCCKQFLDDFDKVSIKMAKVQGLSLNPTKISGVCGRLMCCLAYENEVYAEINEKMPKVNSKVQTPDGEGVNIYNNLLKQTVTVKFVSDKEVSVKEYSLENIRFDKVVKEK